MEKRRIASIDGLRAIAILAVVAFHYCCRWAPPLNSENLYPYGTALAGLPGVRFGGCGVQLFFVISGFVIAMTLEHCRTPREFVVRRYARLAPAMLLFSVITLLAMHLIPHAPFPERWVWFVSSITFIDPVVLNRIVPAGGFSSIDGVYWSLYVEVQFYALACLVYFRARNHFRVIMGLLSAIACGFLIVRIPLASPLSNNLLIPLFLPWFVMGIGFHALALRAEWPAGALLISLGTLELLAQDAVGVRDAVPIGVVVLVPILFAAAIWFRPLVSVLAWKPMVMIGAASYGLYLVHENVGIAILHSLPSLNAVGGALAAVAVAAGCAAVAVASFRWIETPVSRAIRVRFLTAPTRERHNCEEPTASRIARMLRRSSRCAALILPLAAALLTQACQTNSRVREQPASQHPPTAAPRVGVLADPCSENPDTRQGNPDAWRAYDWSQRCRYWYENAQLPPASPARVVFIGDSITEAWREADPALFTNDILNRGIGGQTSEQMLVRLRSDVIDLHPSVVHIMAGTNDVAGNNGPTSLAVFQGNIRSMVEEALLHQIRVVLASVPPSARIAWRTEIERPADTIAAMNSWLREYAQCEHLVFVDYTAVLDDGRGGIKPGLSPDGVHLTHAGYAALGPLARAAIARAISGPLPSISPRAVCGAQ